MANMATYLDLHFGHGWTACRHNSLKFWRLSSLEKGLFRKNVVLANKSPCMKQGHQGVFVNYLLHHGGLQYKLDPSEWFIEQGDQYGV